MFLITLAFGSSKSVLPSRFFLKAHCIVLNVFLIKLVVAKSCLRAFTNGLQYLEDPSSKPLRSSRYEQKKESCSSYRSEDSAPEVEVPQVARGKEGTGYPLLEILTLEVDREDFQCTAEPEGQGQ